MKIRNVRAKEKKKKKEKQFQRKILFTVTESNTSNFPLRVEQAFIKATRGRGGERGMEGARQVSY